MPFRRVGVQAVLDNPAGPAFRGLDHKMGAYSQLKLGKPHTLCLWVLLILVFHGGRKGFKDS